MNSPHRFRGVGFFPSLQALAAAVKVAVGRRLSLLKNKRNLPGKGSRAGRNRKQKE